MAGALEVLAKDQVLTSPTSVTWNVLSSIGAIDVVRPFKNLIDTFETLSKMTINAKAGSNDATTFGMTINTFILNTKKFQERFVSTSMFELCDCYCLMVQRNLLYIIYIIYIYIYYTLYIYIYIILYILYNIKVIIISYIICISVKQETMSSTALLYAESHWNDVIETFKELTNSLNDVKNKTTTCKANAFGVKLVSLVTAFVKDDKPFPDDFSKLVEDLTLHAAALPDDLPDRQKLLDIGLFSKSLASAAGR